MTTLHRQIDIQSQRDEVWSALIDFEGMPGWFFGVRRVQVLSAKPGPGVQRLLTLFYGATHREQIGDWESGMRFTIIVLNPPKMVEHWYATVNIETISQQITRINWEMKWKPRFGTPGALLDSVCLRPLVNFALGISLARLKKKLEHDR